MLISNPASPAGPDRGGPFGGVAITTVGGVNVAVSPEVFLYALGIAVALAIVASVLPAWYIARVRPAEVLRNE
jgi:ABC-type antimicrobial peptide transport system permease subunit